MKSYLPDFKFNNLLRRLGLCILLTTALGTHVFAGNATDGTGSMTVSPASACAGSTGNTFTFTFSKSNGNDYNAGSQATIVIPFGWTAPQSTLSGSPGYIV